MYVGVDDDGLLDTRYDDESTESLMKRVPEVVLLKVPDDIGEIGRGIYKSSTRWWTGHSFSKMIRVIS